jgi:hypothetical protein
MTSVLTLCPACHPPPTPPPQVPGHQPPSTEPGELSPSGQPVISSPTEDPAVTDELINRPVDKRLQEQPSPVVSPGVSPVVRAGDPGLMDKVGAGCWAV